MMIMNDGSIVGKDNPATVAFRFLDMGQVITGGVIAAGATVFSPVYPNLQWVRSVIGFVNCDQLVKIQVFRLVSGTTFDWGSTLYTLTATSSAVWQPFCAIPAAGQGVNGIIGDSAKFAINNVTGSATTVANLVIKLMGQ